MRIALDAMGGDRAPAAVVEGALAAVRAFEDVDVVLVGASDAIEAAWSAQDATDEETARRHVVEAPHVAGMDDDPVRAVRGHEDNSARVCAELLRDGKAHGVVSMGSTGAAVAAAHLFVGRLEGVRRPGIAVPFPRAQGATIVIDAGANPDAKAEDLHQWSVMASLYARAALGVETPRIGILSIGEEEHKGNRLVAETWALFRERGVEPFVGNVEPRELFLDKADVVVADGFAGNIALKAAEGMAEYLLAALREGGASRELLDQVASRVDYAEYGGAPLLGVRGAYLVGHGRSDARAVLNAVRAARAYVRDGVAAATVEALQGTGGAAS